MRSCRRHRTPTIDDDDWRFAIMPPSSSSSTAIVAGGNPPMTTTTTTTTGDTTNVPHPRYRDDATVDIERVGTYRLRHRAIRRR